MKNMVAYKIGKAYDKKFLQKNCRTLIAKKKRLFSLGGKEKSLQAAEALAPPPPRYLMVRPLVSKAR